MFISIILTLVSALSSPLHGAQAAQDGNVKLKELTKYIQSYQITPHSIESLMKNVEMFLKQGANVATNPDQTLQDAHPLIQIFNSRLCVDTGHKEISISSHEKLNVLINLLLKYGAHIDTIGYWHPDATKVGDSRTPLMCAIGHMAKPAAIACLLQCKADPKKELHCFTPLMKLVSDYSTVIIYEGERGFAHPQQAALNFKKIVILLLQAGADINQQNIFGWTAFMCLNTNSRKMMPFMLHANANPWITSYDEETISQRYDTVHRPKHTPFDTNPRRLANVRCSDVLEEAIRSEQPGVQEALKAYNERLQAYKSSCVQEITASLQEMNFMKELSALVADYAVFSMPTRIPEIEEQYNEHYS